MMSMARVSSSPVHEFRSDLRTEGDSRRSAIDPFVAAPVTRVAARNLPFF